MLPKAADGGVNRAMQRIRRRRRRRRRRREA
jgi:hypothetical protein